MVVLYRDVVESLTASFSSADRAEPQSLTTRAQALARLGRPADAVADIEQALRVAPEEPSIRFESALVYALIGDRISAEPHADTAVS